MRMVRVAFKGLKPLVIIFAKYSILGVWQGSGYASNDSNFSPTIVLQDI